MSKHALLLIAIVLAIIPSYSVQAQGGSLMVLKSYGFLDDNKRYVIFGEVVNEGSAVQFVQVVADFFDQDRNQLTSVSAAVVLERLNNGQISPFRIVLDDESLAELVASFSVSVENSNPAEEKPRSLDIIFHKLDMSGDNMVISGRVVNDGTSLSKNTRAVVVLYNSVGDPVSLASTFTEPKDVLPFGSGTFSVEMKVGKIGGVAGYAIYSESSQYAEVKRVLELETITLEKLDETVNLTKLDVTNVGNAPVDTVRVGETILFKLSLANNVPERQQFTYILQIKDRNDYVVSISWLVDHIDVEETTGVSLAWTPTEEGTYRGEAFVWKNLEEAVPLAFKNLGRGITVLA